MTCSMASALDSFMSATLLSTFCRRRAPQGKPFSLTMRCACRYNLVACRQVGCALSGCALGCAQLWVPVAALPMGLHACDST